MKTDKIKIIILSIAALLCAVLTFLALVNYTMLYFWFGKFTICAFLFFPIIALGILIYASIFIFKKQKISYVAPVAIALIGCLLAFILSNEASISKIESDYLKHEATFNQIVNNREGLELLEGDIYALNEKELKTVIPQQKLQIVQIGNGAYAYFFIALETSDRYEGYVYIPNGTPMDWDEYGYFSDALDINKNWFYMSLLK